MKQLFLYAGIFLSLFSACNTKSNEVVVYNTVDQVFSEPVLKDFEKETGITVRAVFDTEETKSTGVMNRLIAEKDNPQCDVFWSGDPVRAIVLKQKGITTPYKSENASGIAAHFKDPEGHWTGFSARARVLIYNKNIMPEDSVPQSILDFTDERFRGKITMANPLFGTTTFHMAALFTELGDDKATAFMESIKANGIIIATSNGDVRKRVAQGSVPCGLTDTDDAFEALEEGAPIGIVFLDQEGMGSLIMPNTVSLINNSPNTENGKKLMDYLLSKETEAKLAKSCAQMPLHKGVQTPKHVPSLDNIKAMQVDYSETARKLEEIQPFLKAWVENE